MLKNKKAETTLVEQVIFYVLNLFFIISLMIFVYNSVSGASITEERYAKTIALSIDSLKPGTEFNISISKLYELAEKNKISEPVISIQNNLVSVKVSKSGGYGFQFVSSNDFIYEINRQEKGKEVLFIKIL